MFLLAAIATIFPILMILVKNYWYITIMRMLLGFSVGFSSSLSSHYANCLVEDNIKGRVGSLYQLSVVFFIFVAQIMNYFFVGTFDVNNCIPIPDFNWRIQLGIPCVLGILLGLLLLFTPDVKQEEQQIQYSISLDFSLLLERKTLLKHSIQRRMLNGLYLLLCLLL